MLSGQGVELGQLNFLQQEHCYHVKGLDHTYQTQLESPLLEQFQVGVSHTFEEGWPFLQLLQGSEQVEPQLWGWLGGDVVGGSGLCTRASNISWSHSVASAVLGEN